MSDPKPTTRAITLEALLPATPEEAVRFLSDPAELAKWFAPYVDGSVGEVLTFRWPPEMQWQEWVEVARSGRLVRWGDPPTDPRQGGSPGGMVIEWTLTSEPGGTRLRMVHSGFGEGESWDDQYDATLAGWRFFLWHLVEVLRQHRAETRTVAWERRKSTLSREALGTKLFGPQGLAFEPERPRAGSVAHLRLGDSRLAFEVQHVQWPTHIWGRLPGLNGALLLVEMEPGRTGAFSTGFWLSTYGLDQNRLGEIQAGLHALADAVFGPAAG